MLCLRTNSNKLKVSIPEMSIGGYSALDYKFNTITSQVHESQENDFATYNEPLSVQFIIRSEQR